MGVQDATPEYHLINHWRAQGIAEETIRTRIKAFHAVGGAEASTDAIYRYLAGFSNPRTRALRLSLLRSSFRLGVTLGLWEKDPTLLVGRVRIPRSLPKPLTQPELELLLREAREPVRSYVLLAAYAGLRAHEIARVRRSDLESYPGGWRLRVQGKGGHVDLIAAHAKVVELLSHWSPPPGARGNTVTQAAAREMKRLGITPGIHRARHSFATRALAACNDLLVVRDLMRHTNVGTTQIYTALADERPGAVIALLA